MVRYADDFVILCRTREDAEAGLGAGATWVAENGLTLHPTKTKIVDARTEGFDFLGYHFRGDIALAAAEEPGRSSRTRSGRRRTARTGTACPASCADVNRTCAAGSRTSNTATGRSSATSTAGFACVCGASSANDGNGAAEAAVRDHQRWPNRLLCRARAVQPDNRPCLGPVNPHGGKTINRRAGCGKSARPVRREGRPNSIGLPYPYRKRFAYPRTEKSHGLYRASLPV